MKITILLCALPYLSLASEKNERYIAENPHWNTVSYINTDMKGNIAFASVSTKTDGTIFNTFISQNNLCWTSFDGRSQEEISNNIPLILWTWLEKRYNETHANEQN